MSTMSLRSHESKKMSFLYNYSKSKMSLDLLGYIVPSKRIVVIFDIFIDI
jgi:hypothetical protein